jgi:DNA end-binding protein Ku
MARAVWSGSISFGLVNVPVRAFPAVRDHQVPFHRLEKGTGARVRNQKVSDTSGKEVESDDIEMGYETSKGHYVTFDTDELAELRPDSTRTVDVADFVPLADIDPGYYERTYWLAPADDGARQAYSLLVAAMEDTQRVGIGSVVMRNKQYLAAVRPLDGALAMSTMRFADDVVPKSDVDDLPKRSPKPKPAELKLATTIIDALAADWRPERYHDTYTELVRDLIDRKAKGEEITVEETAAAKSENVVDLMEALQASVDEAKGGRRRSSSKRPARSKRSGRSTTTGRSRSTSAKGKARKKASSSRRAS